MTLVLMVLGAMMDPITLLAGGLAGWFCRPVVAVVVTAVSLVVTYFGLGISDVAPLWPTLVAGELVVLGVATLRRALASDAKGRREPREPS